MLALGDFPASPAFLARAVARNVALLKPDLLAAINRQAEEAGQQVGRVQTGLRSAASAARILQSETHGRRITAGARAHAPFVIGAACPKASSGQGKRSFAGETRPRTLPHISFFSDRGRCLPSFDCENADSVRQRKTEAVVFSCTVETCDSRRTLGRARGDARRRPTSPSTLDKPANRFGGPGELSRFGSGRRAASAAPPKAADCAWRRAWARPYGPRPRKTGRCGCASPPIRTPRAPEPPETGCLPASPFAAKVPFLDRECGALPALPRCRVASQQAWLSSAR